MLTLTDNASTITWPSCRRDRAMPRTEVTPEQADLVLEIDRVFVAPRELIWRLWRDPEHMVRWHGPEGFWLTHCESDFRVGGNWRRCMSHAPGHEHWISGTYLEIEEPSRLRFTYVNAYDGFETEVKKYFDVPFAWSFLGDSRLSWADLYRRSGQVANLLATAGVGIGPSSITSAPAADKPASKADSNI